MKKILFSIFALLLPLAAVASTPDEQFVAPPSEYNIKSTHPRLFMDNELQASVMQAVESDPYWCEVDKFILYEAAMALREPLPERVVDGRRLLATSREVLCRVMYTSYVYRTTGNILFAMCAENTMLKVAKYEDWNPSHFLDVAEMTAAMAIGYDWLYDFLPEESRKIISDAIIEKGLRTSLTHSSQSHWSENKNNWNQVCNASLALGAMAVWELEPELCKQIVDRSFTNIQIPMRNYYPDGAFAEGAGYWEYGTLYNVLLLDALKTSFGSDFGLAQTHPSFCNTYTYNMNMVTPSNYVYSYGDNRDAAAYYIAPFWFAKEYAQGENLYSLFNIDVERQRLLPLALVWGHKFSPSSATLPKENFYLAQGETPVAVMRSEWGNPNAQYVGVKLGTCTISHSHLDIGSFIYEADGVRWAMDLGSDVYAKLEAAKVDVWNRKQGSQRWSVYRYHNKQHNIYTLNDSEQNVDAEVEFEMDKTVVQDDKYSVAFNLTQSYSQWVKDARRSVTLLPSSEEVVIEDKIVTLNKPVKMDWTIMTESTPEKVDGGLLLSRDGKKMFLSAATSLKGEWSFEQAVGENDFDSENPGVYKVTYTADLAKSRTHTIKVTFSKR